MPAATPAAAPPISPRCSTPAITSWNASYENIHCDFQRVDGYLFGTPGESREVLDREFDAVLRAGIPGVVRLPRAPFEDFVTGPALRFPRQAQFHPIKYAAGLARGILRDGSHIFTETHATSVEGGLPAHVYTGAGPVVTAEAGGLEHPWTRLYDPARPATAISNQPTCCFPEPVP